jgi:DNA-binding YbaB/EbfC family protein
MSLNKLMKQAQRMQMQMASVQEGLAQKTVEATAGGGVVKVVASCDGAVKSIKINPDAVSKDDVGFLEDLVLQGVNAALTAAKDVANREMGSVTSGLQIPGMF